MERGTGERKERGTADYIHSQAFPHTAKFHNLNDTDSILIIDICWEFARSFIHFRALLSLAKNIWLHAAWWQHLLLDFYIAFNYDRPIFRITVYLTVSTLWNGILFKCLAMNVVMIYWCWNALYIQYMCVYVIFSFLLCHIPEPLFLYIFCPSFQLSLCI